MKKAAAQHSDDYSESFYSNQAPASYRSAVIYAHHLWQFAQPRSIVDVGCGKGTWLKAFMELGATQLTGLDGPWNSQEAMVESAITFIPVDLNHGIHDSERYDLAISLEVAEHLSLDAADTFVQSLTNLSDTILFGAAYPGQGGTLHVNEQPASWWAGKFLQKGYIAIDLFRPAMWGNEDVEFWYRQNTFLYIRQGSDALTSIQQKGVSPIPDNAFMDCVHPELHALTLLRGKTGHKLRNLIRPLVPKPILEAIAYLRDRPYR